MKRVYVETYGCQMNVADSEVVLGLLAIHAARLGADQDDTDLLARAEAWAEETIRMAKALPTSDAWFEAEPERPQDVPASDWLRFEQEKHQRLLAAAAQQQHTQPIPETV